MRRCGQAWRKGKNLTMIAQAYGDGDNDIITSLDATKFASRDTLMLGGPTSLST